MGRNYMSILWKNEVIKKLGIKKYDLSNREWILLLLGVDGKQPIIHEYTFHVIFFIYSISPFNVKPVLVSVFSDNIHKTLYDLIDEGLVVKKYGFDNYSSKEIFELTFRGKREVDKILGIVHNRWILIDNIVLKKGSTIIDELTSLKRTYNDREAKIMLKLLLNHLKSDSSSLLLKFNEDELKYLRKIIEKITL